MSVASRPAADAEQPEPRELGEPGEVVGGHREQRTRCRTARRARRRRRWWPPRAGRTPAPRTRTAAARSPARRRRAACRTSRPCRRRHRWRAASCARSPTRGATWPSSDPSAPPVTMIGPSAPNGPPVPMAIADDSGLAMAVRGAMRLCRTSTASIASGMPWPRITGAHNAINVTTALPATAATITHGLRWSSLKSGRVPPPAVEQEEVGEQGDEVQQHPRRATGGSSQPGGEHGEPEVGDSIHEATHRISIVTRHEWSATANHSRRGGGCGIGVGGPVPRPPPRHRSPVVAAAAATPVSCRRQEPR